MSEVAIGGGGVSKLQTKSEVLWFFVVVEPVPNNVLERAELYSYSGTTVIENFNDGEKLCLMQNDNRFAHPVAKFIIKCIDKKCCNNAEVISTVNLFTDGLIRNQTGHPMIIELAISSRLAITECNQRFDQSAFEDR